jgi:hypothetical protein
VLAQYKSPRPTLAAQLRRQYAPDYRTSQSGAKPAVSGGRLARRRTAPSDETEQLRSRASSALVRARVRTHRSDRYRSDLSRDPPSAAASAHETRRVLLGSCKPVPAGRLLLSRRSRERPSALPAVSHASQSAAKVAHSQESLDGERRTRTADTTISVVRPAHLNSLDLQAIPWLLAQSRGSGLSRTLRSFPRRLRQTAAPVCLFAGPAHSCSRYGRLNAVTEPRGHCPPGPVVAGEGQVQVSPPHQD